MSQDKSCQALVAGMFLGAGFRGPQKEGQHESTYLQDLSEVNGIAVLDNVQSPCILYQGYLHFFSSSESGKLVFGVSLPNRI